MPTPQESRDQAAGADFWPSPGDAVVVDDPGGAFHGCRGQVAGLDHSRRPLPWILVAPDDLPAWGLEPSCLAVQLDGGVWFTAIELVVLG